MSRRKLVRVGTYGARFAEAQLNPFGTGTIGPKSIRGLIPDGNGGICTCMTLTASTDYSFTVAGAPLIVQVVPPGYTTTTTYEFGICGLVSTDTTEAALATNNDLRVAWTEYGQFAAAVATHKRMRIVGCGLRAFATSSNDNTSGIIRGCLSPRLIAYNNAGTITRNSTTEITAARSYVVEESHAMVGAKAGITIRRNFQNCDHEVQSLASTALPTSSDTTWYNYPAASRFFGNMPTFYMTGAADTTVVHIDAVLHIEVEVSPSVYPGFVLSSPVELRMPSLVSWVNSREVVVAGHSFKSVLKRKRRLYNRRKRRRRYRR